MLGVSALAGAGLFSLLLVLSRTPVIGDWFPWANFFRTALVVHVNLSVLIWFLGFSALLWSLDAPSGSRLVRASQGLAFAGTLTIVIAPFLGAGEPLLNNYVPMLQHPLFYAGLLLFGAGIALQALQRLLQPARGVFRALAPSLKLSALVVLGSLLVLALNGYQLNSGSSQAYFELLFWAPGHLLQFSHTLLMLLAWLLLVAGLQPGALKHPRWLTPLAALTLAPVLFAIPLLLLYTVDSMESRQGFTDLMRFGGLASLPLALYILFQLRRDTHPLASLRYTALACSLTLFAAGGVLGFLIDGVNVVIPAHYHGSIVGVTLAFMGLSYALLPLLGFLVPSPVWARRQLLIYASGQLMHITGLAWSGGYGVQRKTAGAAQGLDQLPEIAGMALMGTGGLISIIGGVLYLLLMIRSMGRSAAPEGNGPAARPQRAR
ncbi:cbb3-type cytochrome c oxidase subunit I [Aestuariirhabdus litorea]|uniref:Cbb3-type cytochrome c oxidase subunit I n=1 Tax=Aestuariirhabdus litorea TaxID=2528527 RepID=A0A3P3VP55_9GAMM|nr:cbb3-type cytochrome c oxidase subunit I [Aestuariirhabdus litorea]RWW93654.1 cbb3-type cytochrome c oxidase subunit I [Endozoicomonadaceae bacterium GTF-13]